MGDAVGRGSSTGHSLLTIQVCNFYPLKLQNAKKWAAVVSGGGVGTENHAKHHPQNQGIPAGIRTQHPP